MEQITHRRKTEVGEVISDKMAKTIVVQVERILKHPLYSKQISKRKKFYVHDEHQQARTGDVVQITECRPLSKTKRWRLQDIVSRRGLRQRPIRFTKFEDLLTLTLLDPRTKTTAQLPLRPNSTYHLRSE